MLDMSRHGYIVIPNWDHFQHYKDRRPAWVKLHLDLLGNDAWLELRPADRCLLITIWMLVGRYGNGRVNADPMWLYRQANVGQSNAYQGLKRLNDAGFIQVSASPVAHKDRSLEVEGSKEPKKENKSARENGAAVNGADRALEEHHRQTRVRTHYQGFLLENGEADALEWLAENHPDLVGVIAGTKPATKETAQHG